MFRKTLLTAALAATLSGQAWADAILQYRTGEVIDPAQVARVLGGQRKPLRLHTRNLAVQSVPGDGRETIASRDLDESGAERGLPGVGTQAVPTDGRDSPVPTDGTVSAVRTDSAAPPAAEQLQPDALAVPVQFGFDSSIILPQARAQLDAIAAGIAMLPMERTIIIEGHTDAAGAELYNLRLSVQRAAAVKQYLVDVHHIGPERLKTRGFGPYAPINAADPRAAENRRVQFRAG